MTRAALSVAMTETLGASAQQHLLRTDRQEDLCFALWRPSTGQTRTTALIYRLLVPFSGERSVHGNASFESRYFQRALSEAVTDGAGIALMHSHPHGCQWQGMSPDDVDTESGHAPAVYGATRLPFIGLTISGDRAWSGRFWTRTGPRKYERQDCATVRVVGERLKITYMDRLAPPPTETLAQIRTVSAWGSQKQADLTRLRVGLVGAGSVGGFVAEAAARTGFEDITGIDFDVVEEKNLDRLLFATRRDIGLPKINALERHLLDRATAQSFRFLSIPCAVYEKEALLAALDCDLIVSCVDRPWARHVLNLIAYAHLIPVVDGGIAVRRNRQGEFAAADWRAHTIGPGRRCLECIGQYDSGHVQIERDGYLEDPTYIEHLSAGHPLKARENVFAFSMSCASLQFNQMLNFALDPLGQANSGEQLYHFVGARMEPALFEHCQADCMFPKIVAAGDECPYILASKRPVGSATR
ncbi:MAG: ThiF family adenylyltransferase [Rhizobiales bacterium]|nr:ThiF family adenylyltransferase [Hyphomicrobiales bacterium]